MTHGPIGRIRSRVRRGRYRFTEHALEEMGEDELSSVELEQSVPSGRIVRIQRDKCGRKRYTIEGRSQDGRRIRTVCRYDDLGERVVVITVYEAGQDRPMKSDRCDFCSSGRLHGRRVRHYHRVGAGLIVMDAVPAHVCDQCGHRYFDAEVVKEMERLSRRRSRLKDRVSFPRVRFTQANNTTTPATFRKAK